MTPEDFIVMLEDDLGWRKKEVSNLLLMETDLNQLIVIKSTVLLLYSHWEGFVKNATKAYLEHVSVKKIGIGALTDNFKAITLKGLIGEVERSSGTLTMSNELKLINELQNNPNKKFSLSRGFSRLEKDKTIIDTKDNLSLEVFKSILCIVGLDYSNVLDARGIFINKKLVESRNKVAHGNKIQAVDSDFDLTFEDLGKIKNLVFFLMDALVDDLIYFTQNEFYLAENAEKVKIYMDQRTKEIKGSLP